MASLVEGTASRRTSLAVGAGGGDAGRAAARAGIGADDVLAAESDDEGALLSTAEMLQPGGFRRDFVFRKLAAHDPQQPVASPSASAYASTAIGANPSSTSLASLGSQQGNGNASGISLGAASPSPATRARPTRSFIDFLSLYGHFGGEDLEEIEEEEEEEEEDEEAALESAGGQRGLAPRGPNERTPLIRARSSLRGDSRKRVGAAAGDAEKVGDATVTQAVLMLLKSFVGTGVLFLGKACVRIRSPCCRISRPGAEAHPGHCRSNAASSTAESSSRPSHCASSP
jgi:proton-coupled amino acid transporter